MEGSGPDPDATATDADIGDADGDNLVTTHIGPGGEKGDTVSGSHNNNNNHINNSISKPSIRYAEKRRTATCRFADRVAQVSVDHYRAIIPPTSRPPQTCIATIVAHIIRPNGSTKFDDEAGEEEGTILRVVAMGIGTKFLSEASLRQEHQIDDDDGTNQYGSRVRDLHAEVLARRAFRRQLTLEILHDLQKRQQQQQGSRRHDNDDDDVDVDGMIPTILTRSQTQPSLSCTPGSIRYKLKEGVTLHMYTSSAPCGNATLKKFCKMTKERFRDDLGPDEWPTTPHNPPLGHGMKQGEFSLLVKRDATTSDKTRQRPPPPPLPTAAWSCPVPVGTAHHASAATRNIHDESHKVAATLMPLPTPNQTQQHLPRTSPRGAKKEWPADITDDWTPPGTTIVGFKHLGSIHTCSDKICRWNFLGIQGSLLARLLEVPIYITTLIVGRKFSGPICRRAVCCRLVNNPRSILFKSMSLPSCPSNDGDYDSSLATDNPTSTNSYRINHPAVLGTAVYVDEYGVVETDSENRGQDVRFHSTLTWAWWPGSPSDAATTCTSSCMGVLECIDGSTGFLEGITGSETQQCTDESDNNKKRIPVSSQLSTVELSKAFMHVDQMASSASTGTVERITDRTISSKSPGFVTLKELRTLKKELSPVHEHVKEDLLTQHRVLQHWRRRIYDNE